MKKALKIYERSPDPDNFAPGNSTKARGLKAKMTRLRDQGKEALGPIYGQVRAPGDIHVLGEESKIPGGKDVKTGFATIGFPRQFDKVRQRKEFEALLNIILDNQEGYDTNIVQVLGDKFIEDDPEFPGAMTRDRKVDMLHENIIDYIQTHPGLVKNVMNDNSFTEEQAVDAIIEDPESYIDVDFVDDYEPFNDIQNGYDTQRDSSAEFRARKLTPQQILPFVWTDKSEDIDVKQLAASLYKARLRGASKKDMLKIARQTGMSPYSLSNLAWYITNTEEDFFHHDPRNTVEGDNQKTYMARQLSSGLNFDDLRSMLDEIYKHEDEYVSDLRGKNIINAINRRF
jgi:hypothetical protein